MFEYKKIKYVCPDCKGQVEYRNAPVGRMEKCKECGQFKPFEEAMEWFECIICFKKYIADRPMYGADPRPIIKLEETKDESQEL